ncbi:MAG: molybdopterin-dependent oxidoreductase [Gammaproteobacteria bacterium]|nr:molybdopterin-dependent oxidoreductase [Gammaproteobacteria bacterium]
MKQINEIKPSVCPLDCPDTCSLLVEVENDLVKKVKGSHANPYTAGAICQKVAKYYPDFVHGEARLRQPLMRTGEKGSDEFEPTSWDNALSIIAEKTKAVVDQYGAQAVLPLNYAGPHGALACGSMDCRFFHKMGASLLYRGALCAGVRGAAYSSLFGSAPGMQPEQAACADVIAVWGNSVTVSNLHLARVIKQAREQGATLIVVDPKRTRIAEQAHLHIQIAPGTDVVLAQALAAELERRGKVDNAFVEQWVTGAESFLTQSRQYSLQDATKICGIEIAQIEQLVDYYANAKTLACSVGNGIERGKSGGSGIRSIMAVSALLGQLGRPGAGIIAKPGLAFPTAPDKLERPDLVPDGTRTINIVDVGRHLLNDDLDPPIRSVFIYNHNPVAMHPDQNRMMQALSRPELFLVGIEVAMTDSMKFCDVILPAASHFEFNDVYTSYGHSYLQRAEPVISCVAESLPNTEIFRRLAKTFGYDDAMFEDDDAALMDQAFDINDPRLKGYRPSQLPLDRALLMQTTEQKDFLMCDNVNPGTASGKIELFDQNLQDKYGFGTPRYEPAVKDLPFTVISPSSHKRTNATFGSHEASVGVEIVEINPQDAKANGIEEDALVTLSNQKGSVTLKAKITTATRAGVLYTPKGTWLKTSATGQTVNALIDADMKTDIADGACYHETFVEIAKANLYT